MTVSLHTYERCPQMITGDLQNYVPLLRSDPLSRIALLTLPEDSLAVLPLLQEQYELDAMQENSRCASRLIRLNLHLPSHRDAPYSPSFILSLYDISPTLKNLQDLHFLPGFHSPTLALLYTPEFTWPGRYKASRDTYSLEIRTFDLSHTGSYPLLLSVPNLPSDSLYIIPCPAELGGVVLITTTGIVHIDQSGRVVASSTNGWWSYTTDLKCDTSYEGRKMSLEGSKGIFVTERDMLLILHNGDVHQVRFEMDGRSVGTIKVDEQSSGVPPPSCVVRAGDGSVFIGCEEGDSVLARIEVTREVIEEALLETKLDMEVDYDEGEYLVYLYPLLR
jgi:cleavage and polyadenylation specificity factor subunit 1